MADLARKVRPQTQALITAAHRVLSLFRPALYLKPGPPAFAGLQHDGIVEELAVALEGIGDPPRAGAHRGPDAVVQPWRDVLGGPWPDELSQFDLLVLAKSRYQRQRQELQPSTGWGCSDPARGEELAEAIASAELELGGRR
jgi:hypothetical protein